MIRQRSREEEETQIKIVNWARAHFDCKVAHVPNGGKRSKLEAIRFKKMGVLAGFPDLIFLSHDRVFLLEVKETDGTLTQSQRELFPQLEWHGFPVWVARSFDEAKAIITKWRFPPKPQRVRSDIEIETDF